jgi:outer membrane biosynthesis protein TonB
MKKVLFNAQIIYPKLAKENGTSGKVLISFLFSFVE